MIAIAVMFFFTGKAFALEGVVVKIVIEGNQRVDTETIKSYLVTKEGEKYYPARVRQDIKNLYAQGFFQDIRVEGEQKADGIILHYKVVERPIVSKVEITGYKIVNEDDINEQNKVKQYQVLDENQIRETENAIKLLYEQRGFYLVDIKSEILPDGEGKVKILFKIAENKKVIIRKVVFLGNKAYSDEALTKVIATRPANAIGFLTKQGTFIEEQFDNDEYRLSYFYLDNGYIDVKIDPPQAFLTPDKKEVSIVYHITEGPQYFTGVVDIKGDLIREKPDLIKELSLKEGDVYSLGKLRADIQKLTDIYGDEGYADANVVPRPEPNRETLKVNLTYFIAKGIKIYIERIDITGNDKTRDIVIRRQLKVVEGDLYSNTAIRNSEGNVKRLGFFKNVKIISSPGSRPDLRRFEVIVEEAPTGSISAGAGFSTVEDFMFNTQVQQKNLFGRGQNMGAALYFGKLTQSFQTNFSDPYIFDTRFSFNVNLNYVIRTYVNWDRRDIGGSFSVGHLMPRSDFSRVYLTYQYQQTELTDLPEFNTILDRIPMDTATSSFTLSFRRNTTNNYLDPTDGSIIGASVEYAGRSLGGDNDYMKYEASYNYYRTVFKGTYLAFRSDLGLLDHDQGSRLLITERYFLGGIYDLRGFQTRSLGPRFPSDNPIFQDIVIGGNKKVVMSLDYVIPIVKQLGLKGVVFVDAGNAFNDNQPIDPSKFRSDWGVGIRWISPMGPLRFELGFPIDRKNGEDEQVFQFAIGTPLQ